VAKIRVIRSRMYSVDTGSSLSVHKGEHVRKVERRKYYCVAPRYERGLPSEKLSQRPPRCCVNSIEPRSEC
jgi:hypothetical protein